MPPDSRHPRKNILSLPNELLAILSTHVESNDDLFNLALACRKLVYPAQAALLTPLKVPKRRIRHLLETLLVRPDLAKRIHHIDLGDYASHHITPEDSETFSPMPGDFEMKSYWRFKGVITERLDDQVWTSISSLIGIRDAWGSMRSFFLAILVVLAPNLDRLSFEMRPLREPLGLLTRMPVNLRLAVQSLGPPFGDTVTQLLSRKIRVLKVARNAPENGPYMHNLDLRGFSNLNRLSLPMDTLIRKYWMASEPCQIFPASLEHLEVLSCDSFTFLWILTLWRCRENGKLPCLRSVDLFFLSTLRGAMLLQSFGLGTGISVGLSAGGDSKKSRPSVARLDAVLRAPSMVDIAITLYSQPHTNLYLQTSQYQPQDLCMELGIWQELTLGEVTLAALNNASFSEVVARSRDGSPRARTKFENRLLLRFWGMPLCLFTSRTFEPLSWTGVRMFNGNKGTKSDPAYKTITPKVLPKHKDQKAKTDRCDKKVLLPAKFVLPKPSALPSPTFYEASWLKDQFFQETRKASVYKGSKKGRAPSRRSSGLVDNRAVDEIIELAKSWRI
ncbi:hypothetical protein K491DRAFT_777957 [Lophiostoma macrostomum CBS 122681]|uniref:F-box domain-containing protein n=1 Tax=Lophiostoma macrostomum CBS 122681 TaxID=1314788 RepID=A0A6A6TBZ9_9PLEO|nr:hypothetical protein K491DRAFT_777957 [Lophiostoma macrostomum CBS 122681]